jgi:hypothetical protein
MKENCLESSRGRGIENRRTEKAKKARGAQAIEKKPRNPP